MKTTHNIRDKIFKDIKFYQPQQSRVSTKQYEFQQHRHQQLVHPYQSKKRATFDQYKHSSSWNPLHKNYARVDKPYKQLYERKHRVKEYSDMKSDPFSVGPKREKQVNLTYSRQRQQFKPSIDYKVYQERKYILPKDREIAKPIKHYHSQLGMNGQRVQLPRQKSLRNNSSLMKLSLDHSVENYVDLNRSLELIRQSQY